METHVTQGDIYGNANHNTRVSNAKMGGNHPGTASKRINGTRLVPGKRSERENILLLAKEAARNGM